MYNVHNSAGEINNEETNVDLYANMPEHIDNAFLNRDLKKGILGFRYENKQSVVTVYSSLEAKTFCILMGLTAIKN